MPGPPLTSSLQQWITLGGTIGQFSAPGSQVPVIHLSTFASLGDTGTGSTRLTRDLLPVREMFEVGELNFDELLQRDLDDYRVATKIIPYLLRNGPLVRFFPPILAVVVPVQSKQVQDYYPQPRVQQQPHEGSSEYTQRVETYGSCLQLRRYQSADGSFHSSAELRFNPDQARLVIIDGQHRAMAMLAIRRQKTGEWGDKGRDFKHFYEDIAAELKDPAMGEKLDKLEMPVCICFFPSLFEKDGHQPPYTTVQCCRKLFLDVNKNAKLPTEARTILLDDASLLSGITRSILTTVREESRSAHAVGIDLDAFEYDSPHNRHIPSRALAICTVEMLNQLIHWSGFGKVSSGYYNNLSKKQQGRPADPDRGRFLSEILFDAKVPTAEWRSWGYENFEREFQPNDCRSGAQQRLIALFNEVWGRAIINLLAQLHPFRAHHRAVADLRAAHSSETAHGALAYRALFDGQGVLWTLQNHADYRRELRADVEKAGGRLPELQIELAYRAIQEDWLPKQFVPTRAGYFLNKKDPTEEEKASVARSYGIILTQAFQVGVLMAFAYLKETLRLADPTQFNQAMLQWIQAFNQVMQKEGGLKAFDRRGDGLYLLHISQAASEI